MERRNGGVGNVGRKRRSVLYQPRPQKDFIELLRGATEFSLRENRKGGSPQVQVRIGTSFKNSFAFPIAEIDSVYEHITEVRSRAHEMEKKVLEENNMEE